MRACEQGLPSKPWNLAMYREMRALMTGGAMPGGSWSIHLNAQKIGARWQPELDDSTAEDPPLLTSRSRGQPEGMSLPFQLTTACFWMLLIVKHLCNLHEIPGQGRLVH